MPEPVIAWRAVHPDLRSSRGYRWPFPGNTASAPLPAGRKFTKGNACPDFTGDGLCLAKTWEGAASGSIPAITCLLVSYLPKHLLGEDANKVRVSECTVLDVFDAAALIRDGWCASANLRYANLRSADLRSANLRSANLGSANLRSADLRYANLGSADLRSANLRSADLGSADLRYADLGSANLRSADLRYADLGSADLGSANLRSADLGSANLRSADLRYANLRSADLRYAKANRWTVWPDGYDPKAHGVTDEG